MIIHEVETQEKRRGKGIMSFPVVMMVCCGVVFVVVVVVGGDEHK